MMSCSCMFYVLDVYMFKVAHVYLAMGNGFLDTHGKTGGFLGASIRIIILYI